MIYPLIKERDLRVNDLVYIQTDPRQYTRSIRCVTPWIGLVLDTHRADRIGTAAQSIPNTEEHIYNIDRESWTWLELRRDYNIFRLIKRDVELTENFKVVS